MTTVGTGCFGGGLIDVGFRSAGLEHVWGIEIDPQVAEVAEANGFEVTVKDMLKCNPMKFWEVDHQHWSLPCTNASNAKRGRGETSLDKQLARKTCKFIKILEPKTFSLENVWYYRSFWSFGLVCNTLEELGYAIDIQHINCADFGVPQTRKRLILRASRYGHIAPFPEPQPWVGWYSAVEDLLPGLPDSELAPWQLKRLKDHPLVTLLIPGGSTNRYIQAKTAQEPATTIKGVTGAREPMRAVLPPVFSHDGGEFPPSENPEAFLVDGYGNTQRMPTVLPADTPDMTIQAWHGRRPIQMPRALLVHGTDVRTMPVRKDDDPSFTVMGGNTNMPRAVLVEGDAAGARPPTVLEENQPAFTMKTSGGGRVHRALTGTRCVAMTPRALARFQTVPDDYVLPEVKRLACLVVGNGVPPKIGELIARSLYP